MHIAEIVHGLLEGRFDVGAVIAAVTGERFYVVSDEKFLLIPADVQVLEFEKVDIKSIARDILPALNNQ